MEEPLVSIDLSSFQGRIKRNFIYLEVAMRWDKEETILESTSTPYPPLPVRGNPMESLLLPSQLYSLPVAFKNSLGLIYVLVKCSVMFMQVREGKNALFFPNKKSHL